MRQFTVTGLSLAARSALLITITLLLSPPPTLSFTVHRMDWTPDGVKNFNSTHPLEVELGDVLQLDCPVEGQFMFSNLVVQFHEDQYEQCNCVTSSMISCENVYRNGYCAPALGYLTVLINENSADLSSVINYHEGNQYYMMSYINNLSLKEAVDSYDFSGGQCLNGLRMSIRVSSKAVAATTTTPAATTTTPADETSSPIQVADNSETNIPPMLPIAWESSGSATDSNVLEEVDNLTLKEWESWYIIVFACLGGGLTMTLIVALLILVMAILRWKKSSEVGLSTSEEDGKKDGRLAKFMERKETKDNVYVTRNI